MRFAMHVIVAALVAGAFTGVRAPVNAATGGGTAITNVATATYGIGANVTLTTSSNVLSTSVSSVSALTVTPNETALNPATDGYGAGFTITRTFSITNISNIADAYTIASVTSGPAHVTSIAFAPASGPIPVTIATTHSPVIQPGQTIPVTVTLATTGIATGTSFVTSLVASTTAGGTVNGLQTATGTSYAIAQMPPVLSGPGGANTKISKAVNGNASAALMPGASVSYTVTFMNCGTAAATNVAISDPFPAGIVPNASTIRLNGATTGFTATVSGQTVTLAIGTVSAGATETVTIGGTVGASQPQGATYVNVATVSADGLQAQPSTPAGVITGASNVVYDGTIGPAAPVFGAQVEVVDPVTMQPLVLGPSSSLTINTSDANPYSTGKSGYYEFDLTKPSAASSSALRSRSDATPALTAGTVYTDFDIVVAAAGYARRIIGVALTPQTGGLYNATITSLDGEPLAKAGSFILTASSVQLDDVFNLLGNLPLFPISPIVLTKTVDRAQASGGDRVQFTVTFYDATKDVLGPVTAIDTLPPGLAFLPASAQLDGKHFEPAVNSRVLTWSFPPLADGQQHVITYDCAVLPGDQPNARLHNVVTVSAQILNSTLSLSQTASADVVVSAGLFSDSGVITGRVFADAARTGRWAPGDKGVAGVRIGMEDGAYVTTDPSGRFTFAGVRPGMHVLRIDPTSLPPTVRLYDDRAYDSERSGIRLLHGVLDEGNLKDVEFAVEPLMP